MVIDTCPKCAGKGTRPRTAEEDGIEANPDPLAHPIVARTEKVCERCGGSTKAELTPAEIAARNKGA